MLLVLMLMAVLLSGLAGLVTAYAEGTTPEIALGSSASNIQGAQASTVWFGHYLQSSNGNGGFNNDPIKWRVLANEDGKLFLLADQNLDAKWYHSSKVSITWKDCSLRSWLNGTSGDAFLANAFSSGEQKAVATTTVVNDNNPEYNTAGGYNTEDKVFLLSVAEVTNPAYGFSDSYANHASRKVSSTDYAISNGVGKSTNWWWLRSPGQDAEDAVDIRPDATNTQVFIKGDAVKSSNPNLDPNGIRPAIKLDPSRVLLTSKAAGGEAGSSTLTAIATGSNTEWKLTVKDNSRGFANNGTAASLSAAPGGTVTIKYKNAETGSNEYILPSCATAREPPPCITPARRPAAPAARLSLPCPPACPSATIPLRCSTSKRMATSKPTMQAILCLSPLQ